MNPIRNIVTYSITDINNELDIGGKFVVFKYCYFNIKGESDIYFIKSRESTIKYSIWFTITTVILGWWDLPFGPINTIAAIYTNLIGGNDVTEETRNSMNINNANKLEDKRTIEAINALEKKLKNI